MPQTRKISILFRKTHLLLLMRVQNRQYFIIFAARKQDENGNSINNRMGHRRGVVLCALGAVDEHLPQNQREKRRKNGDAGGRKRRGR